MGNLSLFTFLGHEDAHLPPITEEQLEQCVEELQQCYKQDIGWVQHDPLNPAHLSEFENIFTPVELFKLHKTSGEKKKTKLDYENLLTFETNGFLPMRLLIEGEAGAGKTTLCSKTILDWIKKRRFQEFKLVILIRPQHSQKATVGEVLKTYLSSSNSVQAKQLDQYILSNPKKVLTIFDGFDEMDVNDMIKIIQMEYLETMRVIVTARPWKAGHIRQASRLTKAYAFITLEGFNKENISKYIKNFFGESSTLAQDLIQFMRDNDVIAQNMAPFPIYTNLLCVIWKSCNVEKRSAIRTVQTFSQLFSFMINFLRDHFISKKLGLSDAKEPVSDKKIEQEQANATSVLVQIGKTALQGLQENKIHFQEDNFPNLADVEVGCSLGVLTKEKKITPRTEMQGNRHAAKISVYFPHKLFQEFVSALYLASLFNTDHAKYNKFMKEVITPNMEKYRYVLYFTSSTRQDIGLDIMKHVVEVYSMCSSQYGALPQLLTSPSPSPSHIDSIRDSISCRYILCVVDFCWQFLY